MRELSVAIPDAETMLALADGPAQSGPFRHWAPRIASASDRLRHRKDGDGEADEDCHPDPKFGRVPRAAWAFRARHHRHGNAPAGKIREFCMSDHSHLGLT